MKLESMGISFQMYDFFKLFLYRFEIDSVQNTILSIDIIDQILSRSDFAFFGK